MFRFQCALLWLAWQTMAHAGVPARHFILEGEGGAGALLDRAGSGATLSFEAAARGTNAQRLAWVEGRAPGTSVPRLDAGSLATAPFPVGTNGLTVALWFRKNGPGTLRGNAGSENGTIFSMGSGYWDGLRITTDCRSRAVGFEIGQAKPLHSIGVSAGPVADSTWRHVAATWDGNEMRLYIDGLLAAAKPHAGPFVAPPTGAKMRVGYAAHGIGSVVLDVAEVSLHDGALSADAIVRSYFGGKIDGVLAARLATAGEALVRGDSVAAAHGFRTAVDGAADQPPRARFLAIRGLSRALNAQRRHNEATAALLEIVSEPEVPEELVQQLRSGAIGPVPTAVLETLLKTPSLHEKDRILILRQLVAAHCGASDFAKARLACTAWVEASATDAQERLNATLAMGHVGMAAGDFRGAKEAYSRVADDSTAPVAFRAIALMQVGESYARSGDATAADRSFAKAAALLGIPPHLAEEARWRAGRVKGGDTENERVGEIMTPGWPKAGWSLHLATNGNDSATGGPGQPFATLERARDEIRSRRAKASWPDGGAEIIIGGGEYSVTNTFRLTALDSGKPGAPIVFRAAQGERPRFRGGIRLRGFQPVRDAAILTRVPEAARARLVCSDLGAQGIRDVGKFDPGGYASGGGFSTRPLLELYWNGEPMQVARWPNDGWTRAGEMLGDATKDGRGRTVHKEGRFKFADSRAKTWARERDLHLYGYWFHDWADSYDRVAKINPDEGVIELAPPLHRYGYKTGARFRAVNALSEIDVPREYYIDRDARVIYFLPPSDPIESIAEISTMREPLVELTGVSHAGFEGLAWELGQVDGLHAKGGEGVVFAGCTIKGFGGNGITFDGGEAHGLISCDVSHLGRGGVAISGGDRRTLRPGRHFIENCHIHHFSRIHPTYTPAIQISGVGARIRHNLMHDSGSSALRIAGNDHLVEFNEVHHVVLESDDQGGIDMWGDPTFRGNVYRWNYWHDIGTEFAVGQAGIRLDDAISDTLIYGNIFQRTGGGNFGGVQIHGGKDNIVDNNIFIECPAAVSFSSWGDKRWIEKLDGPDTVMAKALKDIDITKEPYNSKYPNLARLREGADSNRIWRNIVWKCDAFTARGRNNHEMVDNLIVSADPGFKDAANQDWELKVDAPVLRRSSFRPIPFHRIGLREDGYRAAPRGGTPAPASLYH